MSDPNAWCLIYVACLLVCGYAVATFIPPRRHAIELFGLAACGGPAIMGFLLIAISLLRHAPTKFIVLGIAVVMAVVLVINLSCRRNLERDPAPPKIPIVWIVIGLPILGTVLFLMFKDAALVPTIEWDAFAIWQLKAKVLTDYAMIPQPQYFKDVNLSFSHLRYPILAPMISAGSMAMTTHAGDDLAKAPYLLLFLGMAAIVFSAVRRLGGSACAVVATLMTLTTPITLEYGGSGTAELPLTAFFAASIACLLRWQAERKFSDLIFTGLFSAAMAWTKNEGAPLAAFIALAVVALTPRPFSKRNLFASAAFCAAVALAYLPWFIYAHDLPRTDEDYGSHVGMAAFTKNLIRLPYILKYFVYEAGFYRADYIDRLHIAPAWHDYWIFWFIPFALAILNWRSFARRPAFTLWILLILQTAVYIYAFVISIYDPIQLLPVTVKRLLMQLSPLGALLIGAHWPISPAKSISQVPERHNTSAEPAARRNLA